jgi:hypothetical protein
MELIQIIESTVFIFSLGLLILLILSYLLFKVRNRSVSFPLDIADKSDEIKITYEKTPEETDGITEQQKKLNERFIVVNELIRETSNDKSVHKKQRVNPRFYIYKPGRNKIVTNLQLSRIKD